MARDDASCCSFVYAAVFVPGRLLGCQPANASATQGSPRCTASPVATADRARATQAGDCATTASNSIDVSNIQHIRIYFLHPPICLPPCPSSSGIPTLLQASRVAPILLFFDSATPPPSQLPRWSPPTAKPSWRPIGLSETSKTYDAPQLFPHARDFLACLLERCAVAAQDIQGLLANRVCAGRNSRTSSKRASLMRTSSILSTRPSRPSRPSPDPFAQLPMPTATTRRLLRPPRHHQLPVTMAHPTPRHKAFRT